MTVLTREKASSNSFIHACGGILTLPGVPRCFLVNTATILTTLHNPCITDATWKWNEMETLSTTAHSPKILFNFRYNNNQSYSFSPNNSIKNPFRCEREFTINLYLSSIVISLYVLRHNSCDVHIGFVRFLGFISLRVCVCWTPTIHEAQYFFIPICSRV